MKRMLFPLFLFLFGICGLNALDFNAADSLYDAQKSQEAVTMLMPEFKLANPDAALVWRITRAMQDIADLMPDSKKKEKLAKFDEAINFAKPLVDKVQGSPTDRAKVYYWYAVSNANKGSTLGVLNALFMVGDIRNFCDKAIAIDPALGDPYYLKAKLDEAVPDIAGGDKSRMGVLFAKAVACNTSSITFIVDFATALKKRNRDANFNKDGKKGVPSGKSDLDYAREMAALARQVFSAKVSPTISEKEKMDLLAAAGL